MDYSNGDLDMLEEFYSHVDFGKGIEFKYNFGIMEINAEYVAERIRLMRLKGQGHVKDNFGQTWFQILMAFKEHLTNQAADQQEND